MSFASAPTSQLGDRVEAALKRVGEFFDLDRVVLYWHGDGGTKAVMTGEWGRLPLPNPELETGVVRATLVPMIIGGVTVASMSLASASREADWSDDVLGQMNLLGELFGNALARQRTAQELERSATALELAQQELARIARVTTMGGLAASIADEISQPLTSILTNSSACLNWLSLPEPNLAALRAAVESMARECERAEKVLTRIRALLAPPQQDRLPP